MQTTNLSYKAAMKLLKEGHAVKRKHWQGFWKIEKACVNPLADSYISKEYFEAIVEYRGGYEGQPAIASHEDTKAHDWEITKPYFE